MKHILQILSLLIATSAWSDPLVIDVRTVKEYKAGHHDGTINVPHKEIATAIATLADNKDQPIYLHCRSGNRSGVAKKTLDALGYSQVVNIGSYKDAGKWMAENLEQQE